MKIQINNCNNIESGEINIEENCLNIKYGVNGTGKSTISKSIEAFVNNDEELKNELVPYKFIGKNSSPSPSVQIDREIKKVAIFNEDYVNRYVFKEYDLLENSFSVFVKTPKYEQHMAQISNLLHDVSENFKDSSELNELIEDFSKFLQDFGHTKKFAANSIISKAIGKGNKIKNIPKGLEKYEQYLTNSKDGKNVAWLKWQLNGKDFLDIADQCPYCSADIKPNKSLVLKVSEEYKAKDVEHLNNLLQVLDSLLPYFSDKTAEKVKEIRDNSTNITESQKDFLLSVKNDVDNFLKCLIRIKTMGYNSLRSSDKIADKLKELRLDLTCYPHLNSKKTEEKIIAINQNLEKVEIKAGELQGEINQQNELLKRTIEGNSAAINEFLHGAGYNYSIEIVGTEENLFRTILKPLNIAEEVKDVNRHLSYGEKNALALALFAFSNFKEDADLIILDDPISSFDGNKKFALLNLLFFSDSSFQNKTVLLLTHEFSTVIDVIKTKIRSFSKKPNAYFLTTKNNILSEKEIKRNAIKTITSITEENIKCEIDNLLKIIYLRRLKEIGENKGLTWQITSSLLHKKPVPRIENDLEDRDMTVKEVKKATEEVQEYIPDFDYNTEYKKTRDLNFLLELYRNSNSNFEKLHLYRLIFNENSSKNVIKKFVNESYHVGNDYVYQLNPREYDTVPQFVIDECDKEIFNL